MLNSTGSIEVWMVLTVKVFVMEQKENGEQSLQSSLDSFCANCSVFSSSSQASNTQHGTAALAKMYIDSIKPIHFFMKVKDKTSSYQSQNS